MNCPKCLIELRIADRQGVEIDYCPQCRGVWLDRGELDKIVERGAEYSQPRFADADRPPYPRDPVYPRDPARAYYDDDDDDRWEHQRGRRRRRGWLGDLFDFD